MAGLQWDLGKGFWWDSLIAEDSSGMPFFSISLTRLKDTVCKEGQHELKLFHTIGDWGQAGICASSGAVIIHAASVVWSMCYYEAFLFKCYFSSFIRAIWQRFGKSSR